MLREPDAEPINGYRLVEPLGTGGFGEVWKCIAPGGIYKAIKFVYGNLNSLEGDAARAEQELRALERVKEVRHPFVLQMDRIEVVSGELLIVMELADKSLHDSLTEHQALGYPGIPRDLLLRYLHDAAEGLDYLIDRHSLLHLDVKPRNLFVIADRVKVADFGLVKHLERQSNAGLMGGVSPFYAPPESFTGQINKHSDQYSLAIVYQELLTGTRPFTGKNIRQLALQHMQSNPNLTPLPEADRAIVAQALNKDANQRHPSCLTFIRSLMMVQTEGTRPLTMPSLPSFALLPPNWNPLPRPPVVSPDDGELGPHTTSLPIEPIVPNMQEIEDELVRLERSQPRPPHPTGLVESVLHNAQDVLLGELPGPSSNGGSLSLITANHATIGVLRPSIFIGVGSFGRRSMLDLRGRLLDKIGEVNQVPAYRFIYIDADPDAGVKSGHASAAVALGSEHLFPMQLQAVGNYRRKHLDALTEWLPQQKLYGIPRSLQPGDSRALGRLAFSDQYLRFASRLKREIRVATHPEALSQSTSQTGLPLRDGSPRIYLLIDATSGLGGALVDLAYAIRRILNEGNHPKAQVTAFLFCGAPQDPATGAVEQANVYATLAELHHYHDPSTRFTAQYGGPDGLQFTNEAFPLTATYLIPLPYRTPEALRDGIGRLTTYLLQDLTTPLGQELEQRRKDRIIGERTGFRSFGSFSLWFPRGLLLREAARQMVQQLVDDWQAVGRPMTDVPVRAVVQETMSDPRLQPERVREQLMYSMSKQGASAPMEFIRDMFAEFDAQLTEASQSDAAVWAKEVFQKVHEGVGLRHAIEAESLYRRGRIGRIWHQASIDLAEVWQKRIVERLAGLASYPGARLAGVEAAINQLTGILGMWSEQLATNVNGMADRSRTLASDLQDTLANCPSGGTGGFRLFGGRAGRALRAFVESARTLTDHRMREEIEQAIVLFYRRLKARLEERLGDLSFCRARLNHLSQLLATARLTSSAYLQSANHSGNSPPMMIDPLQESLRGSSALRVILPRGEAEVERAAVSFLSRLGAEHWRRLDEILHQLVLTPSGGLMAVLHQGHNLLTHLGNPLIEQTSAFLSELLPVTDVAQVEFTASQAQKVDVAEEMQAFYEVSVPLLAGSVSGEHAYLVVPQSDAGISLGQHAQEKLPGIQVLGNAAMATDLMFCREQGYLSFTELDSALQGCRAAYQELCRSPITSPHARFDVLQWIPLEA